MNLVSIIVPIYNVEKYLEKCILSLLSQTYKNIEILLIDDGSTDTSPLIVDQYAMKSNKIRVFHKANGGLSDARNYGIQHSKGQYLVFLDSDDWIQPKTIEILYNNLMHYNADVSEAQYVQVDDENSVINEDNKKVHLLNNIDASINLRNYHLNQIVAWNKMYKKECFSSIRFPVGKIHEDEFTTYKILYNANKIVVTEQALFYYRKTPNSIINREITRKRLDILDAYDEAINFYSEKKEKKLLYLTLLNYLYILIDLNKKSIRSKDRDYIYIVIKNKYVSLCKKYFGELIRRKSGLSLLFAMLKWR